MSIEASAFLTFGVGSLLALTYYWNLYFLFTFLVPSLLPSHFSIGILLALHALHVPLKSLLSLNFSFEICNFSFQFLLKPLVFSTFLLESLSSLHVLWKSLLALSSLCYWNSYFFLTFPSSGHLDRHYEASSNLLIALPDSAAPQRATPPWAHHRTASSNLQ